MSAFAGLEALLRAAPFGMASEEKTAALLPLLRELTAHHGEACPPYRRIVDMTAPAFAEAASLADIPCLPVSLFKHRRLLSVPEAAVRTTIMSSGTTGQRRSAVALDAETARLSARALGAIMATVTDGRRLPFLIIDCPSAVEDRSAIGARAAAILGLMPFGRDYCFALREDYSVDKEGLAAFLARHRGQDILAFGFTFLIWQYFAPACEREGYDLSGLRLLHSGGWKKLEDQAVAPAAFKARLRDATGLSRIQNFYGMAETPGVVFLEGEDGLLYPPAFATAVIRDPASFAPLPLGEKGLIEVLSVLPRSFPGHALLTEDLGVIENAAGGLRVLGRAPRLEMRGCSDVLAAGVAA